MKKPVEIIEGDKSLRLTVYIVIASYLLLALLIEPVIDFILLTVFEPKNPDEIISINKIKLIVSTLIYTIIAFIPASFSSWYGYRIVASAKIPAVISSAKTRFPFTVVVIKGKHAKWFGVLLIAVSLVLIFQLILNMVKIMFT